MGVFVVDKPLGLTSFDVVARARSALGTRRIGHTGTLDPLASGVLVLCTNDSTKLVQFLEAQSKDYLAFVSFGASTPTLDAEGPILETAPVPAFEIADFEPVLARFRGEQQQLPPAYSALHVNGQRAYELARRGEEVKLEPRRVSISQLQPGLFLDSMREFQSLEYQPTAQGWGVAPNGYRFHFPLPLGDYPTLMLFISVSSGTYIRSLARDIGLALGVPAHLAGLVRTRVGHFRLEQALTLPELRPELARADLESLDYARLEVSAAQAKDLRDGKRLAHAHQGRAAVTLNGSLVAIVEGDGQSLRVLRAWQ